MSPFEGLDLRNPDHYELPDRLITESASYVADTLGWTIGELVSFVAVNSPHHVHASQWTFKSNNVKTGSGPGQWVGASRVESRRSCEGCPLLHGEIDPETGTTSSCYSHGGTPAMAHASVLRAWNRDASRYSPLFAVNQAPRSAKFMRFGVIGDTARAYRPSVYAALYLAYQTGLDPLAYTHMWRHSWAADLRPWFLASCGTWSEVERARSMGWRATIVESRPPEDWTEGSYVGPRRIGSGIVCPAMMSDRVTCADCRLCNGLKAGPTIVFPEHGPGSNSRKRRKKATSRVSYE